MSVPGFHVFLFVRKIIFYIRCTWTRESYRGVEASLVTPPHNITGVSDSCSDNGSKHFREMAALGSAITVHSGDDGKRHLCNAPEEKQTPRKTTRFCGLYTVDCELPYQTLLAASPISNSFSWMSERGFWNSDPKSQNMLTSGSSYQHLVWTLSTALKIPRWNPSGSG